MHLLMQINAQLTVDAGNDLIVCCCTENEGEETMQLGACPVAKGGVEPYTYTWSGKYYGQQPDKDPRWIYASDVLNDTTVSNPIFKNKLVPENGWIKIYLKVEDAQGSVKFDSVKIKRSEFAVVLLPYMPPDTIYVGDSIQFKGSFWNSNFKPLVEHRFFPPHGLNDPADVYTWAKPDTTTTYYLQATNSVGCVSSKVKYKKIVVIDTTSVSSALTAQPESTCYFTGGNLIIERRQTDTPFHLVITNLKGQIIYKDIHYQSSLTLSDLKLKSNGLYIITLDDGKHKESFKLINHQ